MVRSTAGVGLYPRPQRGRLSACAECAPRLPQRRRRRERDEESQRSGPLRVRAPLGARAAAKSLTPRPAPAGTAGCPVLNCAALSAALGPEAHPLRDGCKMLGRLGRRVLSPPHVKEFSFSQQSRVLFRSVLLFLSTPQKVSKYSALVASVAPQYPCSKGSSKHASQ